ncbi:RluA family pseudouridine synthase [Sphingosinicella soli]|uniref:tRNA pseudouridine32 synthase/23S rRNA pseudouridine746 synthase n=1 Tax=Sphingosinicella soli TaxID=333708 RepID=A0A7W7B3U6_9SPHN|nr:RNA pseudouridine synthase [Sphingosinicella soli]MBB4632462.1 tRNA pseudouridine32 synthase/23S rRNA pseudouridine746 synthase [Sphingosinicella soli]
MTPLCVLHIDAHMLVIDKPAGLAVHPGPRTPRSLEGRLGELAFGFRRLPQPAHRLDRDTSGCLVLARHPKALKRLGGLFADGRIAKTYLALLDAVPEQGEGRIEAPLAKVSSAAAGWRMVVDPAGKPAATRWRLLAAHEGQALVVFFPETGRTHQIRIHAAHGLAPIVGDPIYGGGEGAMRLHSAGVVIPYRDEAPVSASAPLPADWPLWARDAANEKGPPFQATPSA